MDVETAIQAFASAGNDLPREAMQWTLDHWDTVAPELLGILERFASGAERSDEAASAIFFILHLAGEKQDTRVFPLLCRLAQEGDAVEAALGDGTTTPLKRILISTYDGDFAALTALIEAAEADESVRAAALAVLTTLTATGRIAREETEAYVLEAVSGAVRQAFGRGLTDPMVMGNNDFRTDLGRALANPELSGWSALSDAAKRDQERHAIGRQDAHRTFPDTPQSFVAPLKEWVEQLAAEEARLCAENARLRAEIAALQAKPKAVGRNDPCPCGSGKKFKKCCLH
jgi:uncharacterized protein